MKIKLVSTKMDCDIQVNMTYDEVSDLIWAIERVKTTKWEAVKKILDKFADQLSETVKELDKI